VSALSGRPAAEIVTALQGFREGKLKATVMDRIAKGFTDEEIRAIAEWYSRAGNKKSRT
jgi:cytochrome subunit of sulfide dehydrogenase